MKKTALAITIALIAGFCFTITSLKKDATTKTERKQNFLEAAKKGNVTQLKEYISAGMNPNTIDKGGMTTLMYAAEEGHADAIQTLLNGGADVHRELGGATALVYAVWSGDPHSVQTLLKAGSNVHICLPLISKESIILCALCPHKKVELQDQVAIVTMLIESGAPIDYPDLFGSTPLSYAAYAGKLPLVTLFLKAGAPVNYSSSVTGATALIEAARKGHLEVVQALLAAGANPTIKDINGKEASDYAATEEIKALLLGN